MGKTKIITMQRVVVVKKVQVEVTPIEATTIPAKNPTVPASVFIITDKNDLQQALEHYEAFIKQYDPFALLKKINSNSSAQTYQRVLDTAKNHYQSRLNAVLLMVKTFITTDLESVHQVEKAEQKYTLNHLKVKADAKKTIKDHLSDFETVLLKHIEHCTDLLAKPELDSSLKALLSQQSLDFFVDYYEKTSWKHFLSRAGSGLKNRLLMLCDQTVHHSTPIDTALDNYVQVFDAYHVRSSAIGFSERRAYEQYIALRFFRNTDLDSLVQQQIRLNTSMEHLLSLVTWQTRPEDAPSLTIAEQVHLLRAAFINMALILTAIMISAIGVHIYRHQDRSLPSPDACPGPLKTPLMNLNDSPCLGFNRALRFGSSTSSEVVSRFDASAVTTFNPR